MAKAKPAKIKVMRFRTFAGTPHEMVSHDHATEGPAKKWMATRLAERREWAERYAWSVRDQLAPIAEAISNLNLKDAKVGKDWEWRAVDDVSQVTFMYRIEVIA